MITLHIIAEGHLLDMGVTMKGYTAVIVDIIGFLSKKEEIPKQQTPLLSRIYHKKVRKQVWRVCCGSAMSQLLHGNIIHSIRILGVDNICVNQEKHQSKQD